MATLTPLRRLTALGGAILLTAAAIAACAATDGGSGSGSGAGSGSGSGSSGSGTRERLAEAADELLAFDGVTIQAGLDATTQEVYDYLLYSADGEQPSMDDARRLSEIEVTASFANPEGGQSELRDAEHGTDLKGGATVNFGGEDVIGVKSIGRHTYAKVNAEAWVRDVQYGDEADISRAHRFQQQASRLPSSLKTAARALSGEWTRVEPERSGEYVDALTETSGIPRSTAEDLAGALTDTDELLSPDSVWSFLDGLSQATRSDNLTLRDTGTHDGAEVIEAQLPAGEAWQTIESLADFLNDEAEAFDLPSLLAEPTDPDATATLTLEIRNGVLTGITLDLAQFTTGTGTGTGSAASLPLTLTLTPGSALALEAPSHNNLLTPDDLTVALLYLAIREEDRTSDNTNRADYPGPVQP